MAKVINSLLNKVILFDIIFKVRQVKPLHMSPKEPTMRTKTPEQTKLKLVRNSSSCNLGPQGCVSPEPESSGLGRTSWS